MAADQFPKAKQTTERLEAAADLASQIGPPVVAALPAGGAKPSLAQRANQIHAATDKQDAKPSCQQSLCLNFFFDGTGNNLEADRPTNELSNVAKLFVAHKRDDKAQGHYAFYIPGIGTRFKEIGDNGGSTWGLAFGAEGEARINWAFKQFNEKLKAAEALAMNPTNKITMIRVSAFGFSRGATEARAFARDFQRLCRQSGAGWELKAGGYPVRLYFLGLWDTVASVGLPMSANNTPVAQSVGLMGAATAMRARNTTPNGVTTLAFGQPGADPAPGPADGHGSWANPLDVPSMVEKCVHMVAAHEMRNSFPLDSCRRDNRYPDCVEEMVYPGVHSDVGGGYRPGESARSAEPGQMLSLIPLRAMHQQAWEAGVPLTPLSALPKADQPLFAADEASQPEFNKLKDHWQHYMQQAGFGGRGIGQMFNAHMRLYYGWRFYKIKQNQATRANGGETPDQATLRQREAEWRKERAQLDAELAPLKKELDAAEAHLARATNRLRQAEASQMQYGTSVDPKLVQTEADEQSRVDEVKDSYLKLVAQRDTLPGTEGALAHNMNVYDDQLISDAQAIRATLKSSPGTPVRPHYRNLLDAYEAEFVNGSGLRDEKIVAFFDNYVHDSLAGFAQDASLPSDPRVIYIGDDTKSRHAQLTVPRTADRQEAA
jgi:hypothetical protein